MKKSRRPKKHDHEGGGHHGGSWKVAYADFVTAMMAFFLLLWLLTMTSDEKRVALAQYFQYFGVFDESGSSVFSGDKSGESVTIIPSNDPSEEVTKGEHTDSAEVAPSVGSVEEDLTGQFIARFKKKVEDELADLQDQILVEEFERGLRIEIIDKEGNPMFPLGSAEMSDNGKKVLKAFHESLTDDNQKIALEGHTDAWVVASARYGNWELSTQRASAARRALEEFGLNPARLIRVSGCAETQPLIKDDPYDPRNRRISVLLFDASQAPLPAQQAPLEKNPTSPAEPAADRYKKDPIEIYLFNRL